MHHNLIDEDKLQQDIRIFKVIATMTGVALLLAWTFRHL